MNKEEKISSVFIEGEPAGIKPSSPYARFAYDNLKEEANQPSKDRSITRETEREHRLACLRMATMMNNTASADPIIACAKRFWEFVREGK